MKAMYFVKTSGGASKMPKFGRYAVCVRASCRMQESDDAVSETNCEKQEAYGTLGRGHVVVSPRPHS
jgi:hypothetical protein